MTLPPPCAVVDGPRARWIVRVATDSAGGAPEMDVAGNVDSTAAGQTWTITLAGPCAPTTLAADADAWIDQNSPTSNKGTDSVLKVQSKAPTDNLRALVRFALPVSVPQGCLLSSATRRLFAGSSRTGRTRHARQHRDHVRGRSGWLHVSDRPARKRSVFGQRSAPGHPAGAWMCACT
jgi:hypothetical protein